jgi:hypothetical protein
MTEKEFDYLLWFFQNADFGPSEYNVRRAMEEKYVLETGKSVPWGYGVNDD